MKSKLSYEITKLIGVLVLHGATETKPLKLSRIAIYMRSMEQDPTNRGIRKVIREAIARGCPIGSNGKGYFLIHNEKEMQRYLNSLLKKQIAISQRIDDVYHAFYGKPHMAA